MKKLLCILMILGTMSFLSVKLNANEPVLNVTCYEKKPFIMYCPADGWYAKSSQPVAICPFCGREIWGVLMAR
jgi:hypothetical protein